MATELAYAYMAGLIDGDGCIAIGRHPPRKGRPATAKPIYDVQLIVTSKSRALVDWPKKMFGGCVFTSSNGTAFDWKLTGQAAADLLDHCLSYFVEKDKQAELAIRLMYLKQGKAQIEEQHAVYEQLKALHLRKGAGAKHA